MSCNNENSVKAVYLGTGYRSLGAKYPEIKAGDKGRIKVIPKNWLTVGYKDYYFYPQKWGYIYSFQVNKDEVRAEGMQLSFL